MALVMGVLTALGSPDLMGQLPAALVEAERAKLLEGVGKLPKAGVPGPVALWGRNAFGVVTGAERGVEQAVAAAAAWGKGRVLLLGHNGFLESGAHPGQDRLMVNAVRWVAGAAGGKSLKVGLGRVRQAGALEAAGLKVAAVSELTADSLQDLDVLVLNAQGTQGEAEAQAVADWVKRGGGLVAGMTGWAFESTSGGRVLAEEHGLNRALLEAGLGFTDGSAFGDIADFDTTRPLPPLLNAGEAVALMSRGTVDAAALRQGSSAIQLALSAQPADWTAFRQAVRSALKMGQGPAPIPTREKPLLRDQHATERLRLEMEARLLRQDTGSSPVAAHPAHAAFPGAVAAEVERVTRRVKVNPQVPGWASTGLYAVAGEPVTVRLPEGWSDKADWKVRVGCHSDSLYALDEWRRVPEICKVARLTAQETRVTSAFGGLVYVEVPDRNAVTAPFEVEFAGAVAAPWFVLGRDSDEQWQTTLKHAPAPWAELECDKMIVTLPSVVAREVRNPSALMSFWKAVVEVQDDMANQAAERRRPERMVADVQISAGFMHSGYPIMLHLPEAREMVTLSRLQFPGWGFHHEIGHNHQRPYFTFEGTVEVTNNVLCMHVYHAVLKKDWLIGHPNISAEARAEHVTKIRQAKDKWALWSR